MDWPHLTLPYFLIALGTDTGALVQLNLVCAEHFIEQWFRELLCLYEDPQFSPVCLLESFKAIVGKIIFFVNIFQCI